MIYVIKDIREKRNWYITKEVHPMHCVMSRRMQWMVAWKENLSKKTWPMHTMHCFIQVNTLMLMVQWHVWTRLSKLNFGKKKVRVIYYKVNVLKFWTLIACKKGLDKQGRPRSDYFNQGLPYLLLWQEICEFQTQKPTFYLRTEREKWSKF